MLKIILESITKYPKITEKIFNSRRYSRALQEYDSLGRYLDKAVDFSMKNLDEQSAICVLDTLPNFKYSPYCEKNIIDLAIKSNNAEIVEHVINKLNFRPLKDLLANIDQGYLNKLNNSDINSVISNSKNNIKQIDQLCAQVKGEIPAANVYSIIPTFLTGSYTAERDALIQEIVYSHIASKGYSIDDIVYKSKMIKDEISEILKASRSEIVTFLNAEGHYNVRPNIIEDTMNKKGEDGKTFVEKVFATRSAGVNIENPR